MPRRDLSLAEQANVRALLRMLRVRLGGNWRSVELALPFAPGDDLDAMTTEMMADFPADALPHLAELATQHVTRPGYAFGDEFAWGLELILDGLEQRRSG